jgi:hypothetical protein
MHWLSVGQVTLFCAVGAVMLFVVAGLARAIFEMHQLRVLHLQCHMDLVGILTQWKAYERSLAS